MLLDGRTRPMHNILQDYLQPPQLAYALRLWSEECISKPSISLQSYVDGFYDRQPMLINRFELYNALLPGMMAALKARNPMPGEDIGEYEFPDYDLDSSLEPPFEPPAPPQLVTSSQTSAPATAPVEVAAAPAPPPFMPVREERFEIFSDFIRKLLNPLDAQRYEKLIDRNRLELKKAAPGNAGEAFYTWIEDEGEYFEHSAFDLKAMASVTHILYIGLCNYLGPVEADRALMRASATVKDKYPRGSLDINDLL